MARLLIFDWDGTLCDSLGRIVASVRASALESGLPEPSEEAARNVIGLGLREALALLFPALSDVDLEALRQRYAGQYVERDQEPSPLYPRVLETLRGLREEGFLLAVATGKSRKGLDRVLEGLALGELFDATRCADETCSKPDPMMLRELMEYFGVSPDEALMVGDTTWDLGMARNAGMPRVGVSYGAHAPDRLLPYAPLAVLDCLSEVQYIVEKT